MEAGMNFQPIKSKKIYEEIMEQIESLIVQGGFNPGDKLPSEREMAERLGVSRGSVREALTALAAIGILDIRPGEGTFVASTSDQDTIEALAMIWSVERNSLAELMEVRRILESEAAALCAARATPEDVRHMELMLDDMKNTAERHEQGVDFDLYFHFAIGQGTGNRVLHRLLNTLDQMMHQTFLQNRQEMYASPGVAQRIISEHEVILEAIRNRDVQAAREGMLNHLDHVEAGLEKNS
jgi:GntR family transcriptional repressor for pyruvate dehydrogenase complex